MKAGELMHHQQVSWRKISIELIDPDFGEQAAQEGKNAAYNNYRL
jgi:hypothetical protein